MRTRNQPRGYVLMVVVVMGVILASLAGVLLYASARDRTEGKLQTSSVRAAYAAEAAVAVGVETLRKELEDSVTPNLTAVQNSTKTAVAAALPGATFPTLSVRYYDAITNTTSATPFGSSTLATIASGPNAGLRAQQTPIQVFAVSQVDKATASVADAIRIDLIPVFQFAMFFDGDFELQNPAPITISGRVHTNGNFYLSGGPDAAFRGNISIANTLHGHASFAASSKVGGTAIRKADGTDLDVSASFPFAAAADQKLEIEKWGGTVSDKSTGAQPLSIPLRLSSAETCKVSADCAGANRSCVKVRSSDENGVCTDDVIARPNVCGGTTPKSAQFAQSLAIELIRRPAAEYKSTGLSDPYTTVRVAGGKAVTSPYSVEFGPRPAIDRVGDLDLNILQDQLFMVDVPRSVPVLKSTMADDDKGAILDRMYWKADVRIIDGIWYRKGQVEPVFDPEVEGYTTGNPDPADVSHLFARAIRYSWWWDARENRVYCTNTGSDENCQANRYQRGQQVRSADFDMAAFMALLENPTARTRLFPTGVLPDAGVIVYMSETYDPTYEDANFSQARRAANVRNFLNFPTMHNHLASATINARARKAAAKNVNVTTPTTRPPTPYERGWYPENLWGLNAPAGFESLTRPPTIAAVPTPAQIAIYADGNRMDLCAAIPTPLLKAVCVRNASRCQIPGIDYTTAAARRPANRATSFAVPQIEPTCVQAAATPLGPENAVRLVRGYAVPATGFTFVTDNRLYIAGDINVRRDANVISGTFQTQQDIAGSVAVMADSLTLMSSRFNDMEFQGRAFNAFPRAPGSYTDMTGWSGDSKPATGAFDVGKLPYRNATPSGEAFGAFCTTSPLPYETIFNASLLMGDVPACVATSTAVGNPSGGVNNFPRFVEDWNKVTSDPVPLTINGSIVGLFRSERGNARFQSSGYAATGFGVGTTSTAYSTAVCVYTPPKRQWTFDNTLLDSIDNLPPGTPRVVATDRLRWVRR